MYYDISDPRNYSFEVNDKEVICRGEGMGSHYNNEKKRWDYYSVIATSDSPVVWITTNNIPDQILRNHLHLLKGAKKVKEIVVPNWDEDPYGRRVQRGSIVKQIWDLSDCFKDCKPHKLTETELYEFKYC